jgi:hypothetical protein
MVVSLWCGIATVALVVVVGFAVRPLRPICDLLLAPGMWLGGHDLLSVMIGLFLDLLMYTAPSKSSEGYTAPLVSDRDDC